jgi:hypothetical protein
MVPTWRRKSVTRSGTWSPRYSSAASCRTWLPGAPLLFAAKPIDADVLVKVVESFAEIGRFIRAHAHP